MKSESTCLVPIPVHTLEALKSSCSLLKSSSSIALDTGTFVVASDDSDEKESRRSVSKVEILELRTEVFL